MKYKILNVSRCISDHLLVVYTFNRTTPYGLKEVIRHVARGGVEVGAAMDPL